MPEAQLLNQLHDIQLPDPIGWWPLAFTWWIMIFVLFSILIGIIWYYTDLKRRNAYRVAANKQLNAIYSNTETKDVEKIAQINRLLKQVALTAYGRKKAAALQSKDWVRFLNEVCSYIKQPADLEQIIEIGYQDQSQLIHPHSRQALNSYHAYAIKWIKGHHQ